MDKEGMDKWIPYWNNNVQLNVLNAWKDISEDIIIWSFKNCSISNCLSESKNYLIYELDKDNDEESDKNNNEFDEYNEFDDSDKSNNEMSKCSK
ncbi:8363_t:CDS:2 [Gigaspora margarita]|uniref:8363_t:CDS:1 n=1 Tax=Gigaspora margarita TaxID=4874 RepID=A0ABN7VUR4_GIGMA|nr:8363_t:CDS:2 [Gigaspora margarita]